MRWYRLLYLRDEYIRTIVLLFIAIQMSNEIRAARPPCLPVSKDSCGRRDGAQQVVGVQQRIDDGRDFLEAFADRGGNGLAGLVA